MPEVTFTPRVSVSRMWTPSRIALAASVRRISLDDLVVRRDRRRTPAPCAELRSRSRCSSSRKMRPVVQPQPLPDGVAALHGRVERADARLVAMHEPAVDVDDQVAVALVERLLHRAVAPQAASRCDASASYSGRHSLEQAARAVGQRCRGGLRASTARSRSTRSTLGVPVRRPDAVGVSPARRARRASRSLNGTPSASQSRRSTRRGCREQVRRVDDRRARARSRQHVLEDLDLLRQPRVRERRVPRASRRATPASRAGRGSGRRWSPARASRGRCPAAGDAPSASGRRCAFPGGSARAASSTTRRQSVSWCAITSSRPGARRPVTAR